MSTWASPVIIVPKIGLKVPKDPGTPLPVTAKLRLVCDYRKLNKKLPADFWSYDKDGSRIDNYRINAPYPLPCIDEKLALIRGRKFLTTLDCTGAFHGLRLSPDAEKKKRIHYTLRQVQVESSTIWIGAITIILFKSHAGHMKWPGRLHKKLYGRHPDSIIHRKRTFGPHHASF